MHYNYFAFGLNIESEIECPSLIASDGSDPDLFVRLGSVPNELDKAQERSAFYEISAKQFLMKIDQVARYLVCGGNEITVEPHPSAAAKDVRLFLLGSAMGALLFQRGVWPLHGSAIAMQKGAVLFVGVRGIGKSTLASAFQQRGFQMITDDVCAITVGGDGTVQVWPAYPRTKLRADSVVKLGGEPDQLTPVHPSLDKYEYPMLHFGRDPVPVYAIYVLDTSDDLEAVHLVPLKGFDKVQELTINTYRLYFLTGMQLTPRHFQQAQALARQVHMVRVSRPMQPFLLDELVDVIRRDLDQ
jgi:hypothetical protein